MEQPERCFRHVTALEPESSNGWNNLAAVLKDMGNTAAMEEPMR